MAQTSLEKPVASLKVELEYVTPEVNHVAYFLRAIDIAWSAYTSGGPKTMQTDAAVESHAGIIG